MGLQIWLAEGRVDAMSPSVVLASPGSTAERAPDKTCSGVF